MDLAVDAAIPAAVVAAVAAGVAVWQTTVAKTQARLAEDAATSARRQATAAEAQVEIMRLQLEHEQESHNEARRPRFDFAGEIHVRRGIKNASITINYVTGAALGSLRVRATSPRVVDIRRRSSVYHALAGQDFLELGALSAGGQVTIFVGIEQRGLGDIPVELELEATAREGGDRWFEIHTVQLIEQPKPRMRVT